MTGDKNSIQRISRLEQTLDRVCRDYKYNLSLIAGRDAELEQLEKKQKVLIKQLEEKDQELKMQKDVLELEEEFQQRELKILSHQEELKLQNDELEIENQKLKCENQELCKVLHDMRERMEQVAEKMKNDPKSNIQYKFLQSISDCEHLVQKCNALESQVRNCQRNHKKKEMINIATQTETSKKKKIVVRNWNITDDSRFQNKGLL